jgi:hypothetical protein
LIAANVAAADTEMSDMHAGAGKNNLGVFFCVLR